MVAKRKNGEGLSPSQVGNRYRKFFEEIGAMCETARKTQQASSGWSQSDKFTLFKKMVEMFKEKTKALETELARTEKAEV
jgi:hypothetical protein